jgi:ATP-dependent DNA helicase RecG
VITSISVREHDAGITPDAIVPEWAASWLSVGESETLEFKRTTGQRREAARALCAMLNHRGGRVVFGIEADREVCGQYVSDRTIEEIAAEFREIDPPIFPSIERVSVGSGRELLIVSVSRGANRPYSYRGHAYRRVGNTSQTLSRTEYHNMLFERIHAEQRWENQSAVGWQVADLDSAEIIRSIDEAIRRGRVEDPGTRDPAEILRGLGLMNGRTLLRAALVLFGRTQRLGAEFPQCLLRVARFAGTDKTVFHDNRQFRGNAFELLSAAERFLLAHVPIASRVVEGSMARVDEPRYPVLAVREALANAFCHRDYSMGCGSVDVAMYDDRLEVTSIGSLHFGLTPEALFVPHPSMPWNPLVAGVFYRRGIIETWGRGTLKMAELAAAAGLPRPEIENAGEWVTVRFRPARYVPPLPGARNLTARQQRVLACLAESAFGTAVREIAMALGAREAPWTIREDLAALKALGLVRSSGWGRGARWELVSH